MTRLEKELTKRGIIFDNTDRVPYDPYQSIEKLFCISNGLIITIFDCSVLDPFFKIYDTNYNFVGSQDCYKNTIAFLGNNPFCSYGYIEEEEE